MKKKNAKSNKNKRINKLTKIRIVPNIILMVIFAISMTLIITAIVDAFSAYILDSHISEAYTRSRNLAGILEEQIKTYGDDISSLKNDKFKGDYAVIDNSTGEVIISPDIDFSIWGTMYYSLGGENVFIDSFNGENLNGVYDTDVTSVIFSSFQQLKIEDITDPNRFNDDVVSAHAWIEEPINNDRYNVYYSAYAAIKVKDLIFVTILIAISALIVTVPSLLYIITFIMSIVDQKKASKILFFDPVTGGNNWLYFCDQAENILRKNRKRALSYAIVSLRMERFQSFCTCYGTQAGDEAAEKIYRNLILHINEKKETVARYSDAEFSVLLMYTDKDQLTERIETILNALTIALEPRKTDFVAGIGKINYLDDIDEAYNNACLARKNMQTGSGERLAWYDEKLKEDQLWEHYVEDNMERALKEGELHVYLQPKYNAETEKLGGAEALIRWISPTKGFIGPGRFIPIFEKNGFITQIDDFMLSSVAKLQAKWVSEGRNVVPISVNISRAHFTQEDLAEHICKIVDDTGAPKHLIELELTESAFFEDKEILINTVEKLKALGFAISMDDFGAGYSSLNSLKDLKLDVLKIDADFFRGKEENEDRGSLIVTETIQLAKSLGMTTVAEGIESAEQVEFLAKSGCDLIQGYYFAKPMPVEDYEKKMDTDS